MAVNLEILENDKKELITYCLMQCIRDNYRGCKPQDDIEFDVCQILYNELGKVGGLLPYIKWSCEFYESTDYVAQETFNLIKPQKKKEKITVDYLIKLARDYDVDNKLTEYLTTEDKYREVKLNFEKTHFQCKDYFYHIYNKQLNSYTLQGFKTKYSDLKIDGVSFLKTWLEDSEKRIYEIIDFLPPPIFIPNDTFNTWEILDLKPPDEIINDSVDTSILHKLLYKLTNSGEESYEFLLNYLSHLVQFPSLKPEVGIFFTSTQGSGKDTLAKLISLIIDENLVAFENDPDNIFGKYNLRTRLNKIVVILQEADNIKSFNSKIKDLITCKSTTLADKGVKSITVQDYTRLMIFSNNENILKIEPDDRRWVIFKSWNFHIDKDPDFFIEVYKAMNDLEVINKFKQELYNREIDGYYNFQKNRPITEIYEDLKQVNIPSIIKWAGLLAREDFINESLTSTQMCTHYNSWCSANFDNNTSVSTQAFGMAIKKYFYINNNWKGFEKKHIKIGTVFTINKSELRDFISDNYNYVDEC